MWICDVAEFVRSQSQLDPIRLTDLARRCRSVRILKLGLALARELLGSEFPPGNPWPPDAAVTNVAAGLRERLFATAPAPVSVWGAALTRFRLRDTPLDRAEYVGALMALGIRLALRPTVDDRRVVDLPRWLSPLYSAVRAIRLISTYGINPRKLAQRAVWLSLDSSARAGGSFRPGGLPSSEAELQAQQRDGGTGKENSE
jgi:hypothetical protein